MVRRQILQHAAATAALGACAAVQLSLVFKNVVGHVAQVRGNSMYPTLHGHSSTTALSFSAADLVWLTAVHHGPGGGSLARGDVVVMHSAARPKKLVVKRIVALPGDCVAVKRGKGRPVVIPPGHIWVEGDNATCSHDSTHFGAVPLALVLGRADYIVWPPKRVGPICDKSQAHPSTSSPPSSSSSSGSVAHSPSPSPPPSLVGRVLHSREDRDWACGHTNRDIDV